MQDPWNTHFDNPPPAERHTHATGPAFPAYKLHAGRWDVLTDQTHRIANSTDEQWYDQCLMAAQFWHDEDVKRYGEPKAGAELSDTRLPRVDTDDNTPKRRGRPPLEAYMPPEAAEQRRRETQLRAAQRWRERNGKSKKEPSDMPDRLPQPNAESVVTLPEPSSLAAAQAFEVYKKAGLDRDNAIEQWQRYVDWCRDEYIRICEQG